MIFVTVISGKEYLNRINRMKAEVWIDGKQVEGNISDHPSFAGVMKSQARLYDLQLEKMDVMTYSSPKIGRKLDYPFLNQKQKKILKNDDSWFKNGPKLVRECWGDHQII